jgi:hypothetical protein
MSAAMLSYPGGSWLHPHQPRFSLVENYWCDLLREPAHDGSPNACAVAFGTLGFAAISASLLPFWLELARLLPPRRALLLRVGGAVSSVATALVALLPSDRFPNAHAPTVLTAGGLGFICGCVGGAWALRHFRAMHWFAGASLVLVMLASANLGLYVAVAYFHGPDTVVLPIAQKLATVALGGWMLAGLSASSRLSARLPKP